MPIASMAAIIIKKAEKSWLLTAEVITEVPMSKVGIEKGKTIIALRIADLPKDKAAPNAPNRLMKEVPNIRLKSIGKKLCIGRYRIIAAMEEAIRIGNPVISQWITTLANTKINEGSKETKKSSKVPSLKSSLKIVSTANNEAKSAAIQITPGAKELNKFSWGPKAKGKKVTTIKKKIKGVI